MRVEVAVRAAEVRAPEIVRPELREPPGDLVGLEKIAPAIQWKVYLAAIGYPDITQINVATPEFFEELNKMPADTDMEKVKTYLVKGAVPSDGDPKDGKTWKTFAINLPARDGEIAQADLDPDHRQPKGAGYDIKGNRG